MEVKTDRQTDFSLRVYAFTLLQCSIQVLNASLSEFLITSVSVGPPLASGWNWAVKTGLVLCMMPWKRSTFDSEKKARSVLQFCISLRNISKNRRIALNIICRLHVRETNLVGAIIGVNKQRAPPRGQGLAVDAVAVVLRRDEGLARHHIQHWLVLASGEQ